MIDKGEYMYVNNVYNILQFNNNEFNVFEYKTCGETTYYVRRKIWLGS